MKIYYYETPLMRLWSETVLKSKTPYIFLYADMVS